MKRGGVAVAAILFLLLALPTSGAETGPFDFYWLIFQPHTPWPTFPDLWLFAPEEGQVR